MDYGNSGSMSSSEGDDHDLDVVSRPQSLSGFINPSSSNSNNNPNLFFQYQQNHPDSNNLFDLSTNYLHNALPQPQLPTSLNQTFIFNNQSSNLDPNLKTNARSNHQQQQQLPSSSSAHINKPSISVRNSKKRTRASRRAPTTVLTTDTSNFRAMVQEFTGIPAPPFASASSSPYLRRLDSIFGMSSGSVYPLRPSAEKVHQYPPFLSSTSSPNSLAMSSSVGMVRASSSTSNTSHHDMSSFSFITQQGLIGNKQLPHYPNMMRNIQNPNFNASHSSLLHQNEQHLPPFLSSSSVSFGAKANRDATLPFNSLEDQLGMTMSRHGYQSTSLDGSTMLPLRSDGDLSLRWRDHHGLGLVALSEGRGVMDQNDQSRPSLSDQGLDNSSRSNTRGIDIATNDSWIFPSE